MLRRSNSPPMLRITENQFAQDRTVQSIQKFLHLSSIAHYPFLNLATTHFVGTWLS
jgi:hypothetical protein